MAKDPNPFKFFDGDAPSDDEPVKTRIPIKEALDKEEVDVIRVVLAGPILREATGATEVGADNFPLALEQCFGMIDMANEYEVDPERILAKIEGMPRKQRAQLLASIS